MEILAFIGGNSRMGINLDISPRCPVRNNPVRTGGLGLASAYPLSKEEAGSAIDSKVSFFYKDYYNPEGKLYSSGIIVYLEELVSKKGYYTIVYKEELEC